MGRIFRHSLIHFVAGTEEKKRSHFFAQEEEWDNKAACLRRVFSVLYSFWAADRAIYNSNQLLDEDLRTTREEKKGACRASYSVWQRERWMQR